MPVHNADIARIFEEMADLLEISDANPFRVRAYRNAARLVGDLQLDLAGTLAKGGTLPKLPGIGADLEARIHEIVSTGHCAALDRLRQSLPPAITELLHVPGLGPKRVKALYHELDVQTLQQLYSAARDGRIRALPGFGEKTETQHPAGDARRTWRSRGGSSSPSRRNTPTRSSRTCARSPGVREGRRGGELPPDARDRRRPRHPRRPPRRGSPVIAAVHRVSGSGRTCWRAGARAPAWC